MTQLLAVSYKSQITKEWEKEVKYIQESYIQF